MKQKEIEQLQALGLITKEQAQAIASQLRISSTNKSWLTISLSALAGLLILGGITMLVNANWQSIPSWVKMGTAMFLLTSSWIAYATTKKHYPLTADCFGFIGGGVWLGALLLYDHIFQIHYPFVEGCAIFLMGIIALPFLTCQRPLLVMVAVTSTVLLGSMMEHEARESILYLDCNGQNQAAPFALLFLGWWLLAEAWRKDKNWRRRYSWLRVPSFLAFLAIAQYNLLWDDWGNDTPKTSDFVCWFLMALGLILFRPLKLSLKQWVFPAISTALLLPIGAYISNDYRILGIGIIFLYALGLMSTGMYSKCPSWINYGSLLILLCGIALMTNFLHSYALSALTLISAGVFLLTLVLLLERQRRHLISSLISSTK